MTKKKAGKHDYLVISEGEILGDILDSTKKEAETYLLRIMDEEGTEEAQLYRKVAEVFMPEPEIDVVWEE